MNEQGQAQDRLVTNANGDRVYSFEGSTKNMHIRALGSLAKAIYDEASNSLSFAYDTDATGDIV